MPAQPLPPKKPFLAKLTGALMNLSLLLGMVVLASLLGIGGAAIFVFRQLGDPAAKTQARAAHAPAKAVAKTDAEVPARPQVVPLDATPAPAPAANADEWHFAEFSAEPRYIDVTYDEGRQHARLKVNTVLSTSPGVAPESSESTPVFSDPPPTAAAASDGRFPLSDPGSRYITDPRTGRIVGVDGSASAAAEARRTALAPRATAPAIPPRPAPAEVRVAAPVVEMGRPVFGGEFRRAQVTTPVSTYLPIRRALPVAPDSDGGNGSFDARADLASPDQPTPAASPTPARQNRSFSPLDGLFHRR